MLHRQIDQEFLTHPGLGHRARGRGGGLDELLEGPLPHVVELDQVVAEAAAGLALQGKRLLQLLLRHKIRVHKHFADLRVHASSS